jgi:succinyl-CoA synthetase beta subunit
VVDFRAGTYNQIAAATFTKELLMNIHEYQAKAILRKFGVPVPDGHVCYNGASAREWAKRLGDGPWVVKAQIHAGGRGKGGGVKLARSADEVRDTARAMLGMTLRTHQTGPEGKVVTRVLVENGCNIASELYVSLLVDRATSKVTVMASTEGGMDIEEVAAKTPEKIFSEAIDPLVGLTGFQCRKIAFNLGLTGKLVNKAVTVLQGLYNTFIGCDCSMLEINPLVITAEGNLLALDAKFGFDDNAIFRHLQIGDMRDYDEEDPNEIEASQHDLSYISLTGNIGCLVNGAGLARATM